MSSFPFIQPFSNLTLTQMSHMPHSDLAEFCEFVIASLFDVAPSSSTAAASGPREGIDTPPYTPPPEDNNGASSSSSRKEPPALVEFIVSITFTHLVTLRPRSLASRLLRGACKSPWRRAVTKQSRSSIQPILTSMLHSSFIVIHHLSRPTHYTELAYPSPSSINLSSFYRA